MNNLLSYCWLVDAKIRASVKDLCTFKVIIRKIMGKKDDTFQSPELPLLQGGSKIIVKKLVNTIEISEILLCYDQVAFSEMY